MPDVIKESKEDKYGHYDLLKTSAVNSMPVISVVMSVYNSSKYLSEAVKSVLGQTFDDFEFIVINDGSTDETMEILKQYQKQDSRLIIIDQKNMGLTKSLNRGCWIMKGEFIARQDADDISVFQRFNEQLVYMKTHPEVMVAGTFGNVFNENGVVRKNSPTAYSAEQVKRSLEIRNLFMHGSAMIRQKCLKEVGYYREFFRYSQDYDLWLRISESYEITVLPELMYQYRVASESISVLQRLLQKQYADIARQFHFERIKAGKDSYDEYILKYPNGLPAVVNKAGKYDYHICLAKEFIGANKLSPARNELRYAWQYGYQRWYVVYLFMKSLLGRGILDVCRYIKTHIKGI